MKQKKHFIFFPALLAFIYCGCSEKDSFQPQGGLLPTNYIAIKDSSFNPASLKVANGSSITFLNQSTVPLTIMSDDSTSFKSVIAPDSSFYYKPDTATTIPVLIYIPYHCVERSSARGTIILTQ